MLHKKEEECVNIESIIFATTIDSLAVLSSCATTRRNWDKSFDTLSTLVFSCCFLLQQSLPVTNRVVKLVLYRVIGSSQSIFCRCCCCISQFILNCRINVDHQSVRVIQIIRQKKNVDNFYYFS